MTDYSVKQTDQVVSGTKLTSQSAGQPVAQVTDLLTYAAKLTSQPGSAYDRKRWKRSRIKSGYLIKRFSGYSISETEYGVCYLFVLSRKPDRTSADYSVYPFAGFFNWRALDDAGLFVKEKKDGRKYRTK